MLDALAEAVLADAADRPEAYEPDVLDAWTRISSDLRRDPSACADRLDWVAKLELLQAYAERHGLPWSHPRLAQLDLAWARLDRPGPFDALATAGRLRRSSRPRGTTATVEPRRAPGRGREDVVAWQPTA